jgi:hypothetical protein
MYCLLNFIDKLYINNYYAAAAGLSSFYEKYCCFDHLTDGLIQYCSLLLSEMAAAD